MKASYNLCNVSSQKNNLIKTLYDENMKRDQDSQTVRAKENLKAKEILFDLEFLDNLIGVFNVNMFIVINTDLISLD